MSQSPSSKLSEMDCIFCISKVVVGPITNISLPMSDSNYSYAIVIHQWPYPELTDLRKKLLLRQEVLARFLGVSSMTVSHWETGHRKPAEPLRRLIAVLNKLNSRDSMELLNQIARQKRKPLASPRQVP